ncbi:MAG: Mrp/NBP35 family ATP-binding protein [Rhodothermales bacterium]|nr:Mrp/NBP35 family ATP-binding protein [Rhodothermales bacterium]
MAPNPASILRALRTVIDPSNGLDLVRNDRVRDLQLGENRVSLTLVLSDPGNTFGAQAVRLATDALTRELGAGVDVAVALDHEMISLGMGGTPADAGRPGRVEFGRTSTIAVASGKGGVGKSTVAVNLAASLAKQGFAVGLVDTDIYGPSIPTMFGIQHEKPRVNADRKIVPIERYGVRLLSMGLLADTDQAVIWRGPMVSGAVRQFLADAAWGDLDYLILDLPPGTGDIQLTIVQTLDLTGAIIVSTPQDVALADAKRGVSMFQNVHVPVLGIVENMAYFTPPDLPDRKYYLFGQGGARRLAETLDVPFLGEVPIEQKLRESGDAGVPIVIADEEGPSARAFKGLAEQAATHIALHRARKSAQTRVEILYR